MSTKKKSSYISGIAGLRALAALMVVFYHLKFSFAPGGLLGVTVFFTVSGFLVARNLLRECEKSGKIRLGNFWKKRFARILPALIAMITVSVPVFAVFNRVLFTKECRDILPTVTFVNNWWQIFNKVSYFENAGAPSPLTHCWSLAIEMQFYLVISLLFVFFGKSENRKKILGIAAAVISVISMILMFVLFDPAADPSRVYYGTDTRIFSLMAGVLLALYEKEIRRISHNDVLSGVTGFVSLACLLFMMITISGYAAFMYRGGQILATVLSCLVILSLFAENSVFSKVMSVQPLKWIGDHSYGIYLWHFPVILLLTNGEKASWILSLLAIAVSLGIAELSEVFVETPVASGFMGKCVKIMRTPAKSEKGKKRKEAARTYFLTTAGIETALVIAACLCAVFVPKENALSNMEELEKQAEAAAEKTDQKIKEREEQAAKETENTETQSEETDAPVQKKTDEEIIQNIDILMIGDSIALGASDLFYETFPNSICDAAVSRYTTESMTIYDIYRYEHGWDGDAVIFALGSNGLLYDSLPSLRSMIGEDRPFFILTARAPHTEWADGNNEEIRAFAEENANTYIADWYAASEGHPEYFIEDDTHLTPEGSQAYINCIKEKILEVFRDQ